ncbi:medium-chain acyl-CoA ligase ACSF2, mitochondrial-like [Lineus longissimus]|uniref:medium-chain acyl-CoA ligase ACSF2, mitochondrial-like n=1 Tax=Lineus longissimus TaxID=88925 RepID=UPI00315C8AF9
MAEPISFDIKPCSAALTQSHFIIDDQPPICSATMAGLFVRTCKKYGNKDALVFRHPDSDRLSVTFTELLNGAEAVADVLMASGVEVGDTVGIIGPNCPEWVMAEYGVCLTGGVGVRLFSASKSVDDLRFVTSKADCKGILFHPGRDGEFQELIESFLSGVNALDFVFSLTDLNRKFKCLDVMHLALTDSESYQKKKLEERLKKIAATDIVSIYLTSGSTGFPKLVALNSVNILNQCPGQLARYGLKGDDILLTDRPFSHVGSFSHFTVCPGLTRIIIDPNVSMNPNNAEYVFRVIEEEKPTSALLFLYLLHKYLEIKETAKYNLKTLKLIMTGGQPTPRDVIDRVLQYVPVQHLYGSTELSGGAIIASLPTDDLDVQRNNTGYPMPLTEMKIVDEAGEVCPTGDHGELYVKTPLALVCYWKDEEKTNSVKTKDGWYKTGDVAIMNEHGYVKILGRKDDAIQRAAIKIFPAVVEKHLLQLEEIDKAVVVGVPDEAYGEELCACIIPKQVSPQQTLDEIKQLKRKVRECSAGYLYDVNYVLVWDSLPLNANQKLDRKRVKEMAAEQVHLGI